MENGNVNWLKKGIKRYDDWCKELGLTPGQKRSCVPYREEPAQHEDNQDNAPASSSPDKSAESCCDKTV
ncbi:DUF5363 family protein [Vibrio sp. CAU 1672]|uniref:DUF5363 family protein n=1 Tax=Vibrio sp. CAU 1672 TaxID=3032594 RepID=UPI0023DC1535|nr:DUF5363 family protein [Vibrio sp. CAU 1672]MDF2154451.1 DUF5363 family protein [Vibrio sp. CAU 1672]